MGMIETKFSVGDVVYHATTTTKQKQHPCPDCNGERKWSVLSPAGGEYTIACPRCAVSFLSDRELSLAYTAHVPATARLTIGSIQINTAPSGWDSGTRYMCFETGVGGGTIYKEESLFLTEEEALTAAADLADEANNTQPHIVRQYHKTLEISDYKLDSAKIVLAKRAQSRAGELLWNLSDLFAEIEEASDKDAIIDAVAEYKSRSWESDKSDASQVSA